jgi:hypothetical protein
MIKSSKRTTIFNVTKAEIIYALKCAYPEDMDTRALPDNGQGVTIALNSVGIVVTRESATGPSSPHLKDTHDARPYDVEAPGVV